MSIRKRRSISPTLIFAILGGVALSGVWGGCGVSSSSLCKRICECEGCSKSELEDCIDEIEDERKEAGEKGCSDQFEAFLSCFDGELECKDDRVDDDGCEFEQNALSKCENHVVHTTGPGGFGGSVADGGFGGSGAFGGSGGFGAGGSGGGCDFAGSLFCSDLIGVWDQFLLADDFCFSSSAQAYFDLQSCACDEVNVGSGCGSICDGDKNGTGTANFCNGVAPLTQCNACLSDVCGTFLDNCSFN